VDATDATQTGNGHALVAQHLLFGGGHPAEVPAEGRVVGELRCQIAATRSRRRFNTPGSSSGGNP
jgi:hypothetical protein